MNSKKRKVVVLRAVPLDFRITYLLIDYRDAPPFNFLYNPFNRDLIVFPP